MTRQRHATPWAPASGGRPLLLLLACAIVLSGCARVLDRGSSEAPVPSEPEGAVQNEREEALAPEAPVLRTSAMVDEAVLHYTEGRYETARNLLTRYLEGENGADLETERARAIWGLAMVHLTPESPTHDPERGKSLLDQLSHEFPGTTWSTQARWAHGLLAELERVRTEAAEQEVLLRQLTETVEQLRRIDLNRRPTGGAADTLRSGGNGGR